MNMQVTDWAEHYKAVKARIATAKRKPPPPGKVLLVQPPEVVWPPKVTDKGMEIYAAPIGPANIPGWRDWLNVGSVKEPERVRADEIIKYVCQRYQVTKIDLCSVRRTAHLVLPRHHAFYLLKHHTSLSYPQIGKMLGGKDHTTAMHGVRRFQALLDEGRVTL